MAGGARIVFNERELAALLSGPNGVVAKDLLRRGQRVETRAKVYATGYGGGPRVRTGRLRGSITSELRRDAGGLVVVIGTATSYAPYVELGTRKMRARPFLRPALSAAGR